MTAPSVERLTRFNRLLKWRDLIAQLAEPVELRHIDTIDALAGVRFEMDTVIGGSYDIAGHFCPTAACAVGSAALHPWFNAEGLERNTEGYSDNPCMLLHGRPVLYCDESVADFFGLDHPTYLGITNPSAYPEPDYITPTDVLVRIDAAIAAFNQGETA